MKEYKNNEELIKCLENKNVIINNKNIALNIIDNYSYYSVVNTYNIINWYLRNLRSLKSIRLICLKLGIFYFQSML